MTVESVLRFSTSDYPRQSFNQASPGAFPAAHRSGSSFHSRSLMCYVESACLMVAADTREILCSGSPLKTRVAWFGSVAHSVEGILGSKYSSKEIKALEDRGHRPLTKCTTVRGVSLGRFVKIQRYCFSRWLLRPMLLILWIFFVVRNWSSCTIAASRFALSNLLRFT